MPDFNGSVLFRQYRAIAETLAVLRSTFSPFPFSPSNFTGFESQNTTIRHFGTRNFCDATYDICPLNLADRTPRHLSTIEFK